MSPLSREARPPVQTAGGLALSCNAVHCQVCSRLWNTVARSASPTGRCTWRPSGTLPTACAYWRAGREPPSPRRTPQDSMPSGPSWRSNGSGSWSTRGWPVAHEVRGRMPRVSDEINGTGLRLWHWECRVLRVLQGCPAGRQGVEPCSAIVAAKWLPMRTGAAYSASSARHLIGVLRVVPSAPAKAGAGAPISEDIGRSSPRLSAIPPVHHRYRHSNSGAGHPVSHTPRLHQPPIAPRAESAELKYVVAAWCSA